MIFSLAYGIVILIIDRDLKENNGKVFHYIIYFILLDIISFLAAIIVLFILLLVSYFVNPLKIYLNYGLLNFIYELFLYINCLLILCHFFLLDFKEILSSTKFFLIYSVFTVLTILGRGIYEKIFDK